MKIDKAIQQANELCNRYLVHERLTSTNPEKIDFFMESIIAVKTLMSFAVKNKRRKLNK